MRGESELEFQRGVDRDRRAWRYLINGRSTRDPAHTHTDIAACRLGCFTRGDKHLSACMRARQQQQAAGRDNYAHPDLHGFACRWPEHSALVHKNWPSPLQIDASAEVPAMEAVMIFSAKPTRLRYLSMCGSF